MENFIFNFIKYFIILSLIGIIKKFMSKSRDEEENITNSDVIDEMTIISLTNSETLIAELIIDVPVIPEKLGAYGDGVHDDSDVINACFNLEKPVLLVGYYKCENDVNITNGAELTISGINYNKSCLKFVNEAKMVIGSNSNVNELRLNNFSITGDRTQTTLCKISYITNVSLNQMNITESSGYLLDLDHADIVFINNSTFAGSNVSDVWQPCKGIKLTSCNPIYINNCNIWNLTQFIDIIGLTRTVNITNNWIETVTTIVNSVDANFNHTNIIVENNSMSFTPHGSISYTNSRIVNLNNITDPFDTLISVKNNNIIYYNTHPTNALVELTTITSQCNVYIENNIMFTRLGQMSAYALKVDAKRETKLYYTSTTNADAGLGCATDGVLNKAYSPREMNIKNLNLTASEAEIPILANMSNGHVWYNSGLWIKDADALKRIPITTRETITNIPDTSTVTTADTAAKLNALMNILRRTNIIG